MPSTSLHGSYSLIGEYFEGIKEYEKALINYDSALLNSDAKQYQALTEFPNDTSLILSMEQLKTISRKVLVMEGLM